MLCVALQRIATSDRCCLPTTHLLLQSSDSATKCETHNVLLGLLHVLITFDFQSIQRLGRVGYPWIRMQQIYSRDLRNVRVGSLLCITGIGERNRLGRV